MRTRNRLLATVLGIAFFSQVYGQVGQSPFSVNGIGDVRSLAQANQFGMAEVGIATPTTFHINNMNPAMLTYNAFSSFQMGAAADYRSLSTEDLTQTNGGALLNNLVFSFPVIQSRWTTSIGLMPLSNVNYNIEIKGNVTDTPIPLTTNFEGDGGLVRAYFANGVVIAKGLSLGIRGSYIFGSIDNSSSNFIGLTNDDVLELLEQGLEPDTTFFSSFTTQLSRGVNYGDFTVGFGLHYRYAKNATTFYNFGFTFDPSTSVSGKSTVILSRTDLLNRNIIGNDTLALREPGSFRLPSKFGFGFSYEKLLKLTAGIDFSYQNWSNSRDFNGNTDGFRNPWRVAIGAVWIPNIGSVNNYLARMSYRLGFSYEQSPYIVNGTEVNDFGINFGWSLPVGQGSSFDMGFRLGQRGNLSDNPLRERYFTALLGVTINDRWFVRRRFD